MNAFQLLIFGLQFIAIVALVWDNIVLKRTAYKLSLEAMDARNDAFQAKLRLVAALNTKSPCSPSSKS